MHKEDLALNSQQWSIGHKTKLNLICPPLTTGH